MNVRLTAVREQTKKTIELAIKRIQQGAPRIVEKRTKLSIAAVAREAGVSNATIHNRYPDLANKIRKLMHDTHKSKSLARQRSLQECSAKLTQARKEIEQLKSELAKSQSINLRLMKENELLLNSGGVN